jgi:hypothetical protein
MQLQELKQTGQIKNFNSNKWQFIEHPSVSTGGCFF